MFDLNLVVYGYLFLRLAPFIIACFFTLASVLNADYKGVIYLAGLILSSVIIMVLTPIIHKLDDKVDWFKAPDEAERAQICKEFRLIEVDGQLPQSQSILSFTFAYLLFPMIKNQVFVTNIPTLIFFPLLIGFDFVWNINNSCFRYGQLIVSLILGGLFGYLWAMVVSSNGKVKDNLYFTNGSPDLLQCSRPSKSTFKCDVYKGGKLLTNNIGG